MHVHLVFVAKYRRLVFDGDAIDRLRGMFASTSNSNRRHTSQQRTPMASALSFPDQARRLCLNVATRQIAWTRFAAHYDQNSALVVLIDAHTPGTGVAARPKPLARQRAKSKSLTRETPATTTQGI
jgi:hypothetical protein